MECLQDKIIDYLLMLSIEIINVVRELSVKFGHHQIHQKILYKIVKIISVPRAENYRIWCILEIFELGLVVSCTDKRLKFPQQNLQKRHLKNCFQLLWINRNLPWQTRLKYWTLILVVIKTWNRLKKHLNLIKYFLPSVYTN